MDSAVERIFQEAIAAHSETLRQSVHVITQAATILRQAVSTGGKILLFGNGGSASDAQHFASELVNRFQRTRPAFAGLALTTDASVITSIANDDSFERIFARQIEALGRAGDVAVGISTSGKSPNVVAGLDQARRQSLATVALVGATPIAADVCITVPATVTARIQEVHRTIIHVCCELIER